MPEMTEAIDRAGESFRRRFRARQFENVCVLTFPEDFNLGNSDALSLWNAGLEWTVRGGVDGFVFDLTEFSRHVDVEERFGDLVACVPPVLRSGGLLNWLHGSRFVQEWKRLKLLGVPPDNFETEQEAIEAIQTALKAARIRADLPQRVVNSGVSIRQVANVAGLFESDVRRIAEGLEEPSDRVTLLISSALDTLTMQKSSINEPDGAA